jgi:uncharacterized protein YkwD
MKRFGGIGLILVAVALAQAAPSVSATSPSAELIQTANATRAQYHLGGLHASGALMRSAQLKAGAIVRCNSFSHTPCGAAFTRTFQQAGYFRARTRVGENLYWGTGGLGTPANAVNAWLHSPPHRANLLGGWHDAGVAVVHESSLFGYQDVWVFVLEFGRHG